ncbi:hypothetical protein P9869_00770 [Streptomyces ossamyceticus]|nr:hypothetical protein [Streptomyces ossamyceticus]
MTSTSAKEQARMGPWRFVVWFGTVSLLADFVYEGARSITGPLLASLGASALVVGVVTGAGEAAALGLRLVSGPMADRTRRFWGLAIGGYALTVVSVPSARSWSSPSSSPPTSTIGPWPGRSPDWSSSTSCSGCG